MQTVADDNILCLLLDVFSTTLLMLQCQMFQIAAVRRVQRHTGLTYNFLFLTFGRSGTHDWEPERPNIRNKNGGLTQYRKVESLNGIYTERVK